MSRSSAIPWTVDIERVSEAALEAASDEDALDFAVAAIELGAGKVEAALIDEFLTLRRMRATGCV